MSAVTPLRPKATVDEICICGAGFCDCAREFLESLDPDWVEHFAGLDEWDAIEFYRDGMSVEEWNLAVSDWRASCGVE